MSSQRHKREVHGVDSAWQEDRLVVGTGYGGGVRVPDVPPFYPPPSSYGGGKMPSANVIFSGPITNQNGNQSVAFGPFDTSTFFTAPDTPLNFTIESGTLPSQLSIAAATGVISGTPDTIETQTVSVRCTDNDGDFAVSNTFDIIISA